MFTGRPFSPLEILGEYTGIVRSFSVYDTRNSVYKALPPLMRAFRGFTNRSAAIESNLFIDATTAGNEISRVATAPSAATANAKWVETYAGGLLRILLVATRGIDAGEEILVTPE